MPYEYRVYPAKEIGLKSCPYCGNDDVELVHDEIIWFVWCKNYQCTREKINCYATKEEALEDWERECERIAVS